MRRHVRGRPARPTRWCERHVPWLRTVQLAFDIALAALVYANTGVPWLLLSVRVAVAAPTALLVLDTRASRRSSTLARGL